MLNVVWDISFVYILNNVCKKVFASQLVTESAFNLDDC